MSELEHRIGNISGGNHIRLYRISGDENELRETLIKMGDGEPLHGDTLLPNFLGVPVLDPFHVVAEVTSSTSKLTYGVSDNALLMS